MQLDPMRFGRSCECGDHHFAYTSRWGCTLVSPEDAWWLQAYVWSILEVGRLAYAMRNVRTPHKKTTTCLHREIVESQSGIDHRNGNGLDNRRHNLRPADQSANNQNKRRRCDSKTGLKGVVHHKKGSRGVRCWQAGIHINGKRRSLGYFASKEEAARAYDAAARAEFGSFARVNFPLEGEAAA